MAKRKKKKQPQSPIAIAIIVVLMLIFAREELFSAVKDAFAEYLPPQPSIVVDGESLTYHIIDVGQGDCTFILGPEKNVLIDAGENGKGKNVVAYLQKLGIKKLDYVIGTHGHSDHIGGLDEVLNVFPTATVLIPDIPEKLVPTTKTFRDFLDAAEKSGAQLIAVASPMTIDLGGGGMMRIFPPKAEATDTNNTSLFTFTTFGSADFFSSGDAEKESELSILATQGLSSTEVMKLGHHGSTTSNTTELLAVLQPTSAFINVGAGNDYGHPHDKIMTRIQKYTKIIPRTDLDGDFYYSTDGSTITLHVDGKETDIPMK